MTRLGSAGILLALALLALAGVPLLGRWALWPAGLLLLLAAVPLLARGERAWYGWAALGVGLLGGGLGVATALVALAALANAAPYRARSGFGAAALLCAAAAMAGGALARARPHAAIGLLLAGSAAGSLAMGLFTIDTWYYAALLLCWLAAMLTALQPRQPAATAGRGRRAGQATPAETDRDAMTDGE